MSSTRRTVLTAIAATPVLFAAGNAAADPDAELHRLIAEYWRLDAEAGRIRDQTGELPDLNAHLLPQIEHFDPQTLSGVLAKLRFCFDEHEVASLIEAAPFDRIGGRGLLDLFRMHGIA